MTTPDEPTISDPPAKRHGDALEEAAEKASAPVAEEPDEGAAAQGEQPRPR